MLGGQHQLHARPARASVDRVNGDGVCSGLWQNGGIDVSLTVDYTAGVYGVSGRAN